VTTFGATTQPAPRLGAVVRYLVGVGGLAFTLTILWLSMRLVLGIGGFCASGGPYVPAVECPDAVIALTPLSIFGLFLFGGLALWGGAQLGAGWAGLISLAWPALFLSLGWNFLEFGLNPPGAEPGELAWGWLICAVVFGVMGGVPLAFGIWGLREAMRGRSDASRSTYGTRRVAATPLGGFELHVARRGFQASAAVAERLERLARLRDAGDLTDAEFEAAKRATLDEAGG
jgi:Short C-terminal domain